MLTQKQVQHLFAYCPETGVLFWKNPPTSRIQKGDVAGTINKAGYRQVKIAQKIYYVHRIIFLYVLGKWPEKTVDHLNQIKDDNRWENLRDVPFNLNCRNRAMQSNNTTGYTGIFFNYTRMKYTVRAQVNKKEYHGGFYDDLDSAVDARQTLIDQLNAEGAGFTEQHGL
jgi:hypothetical protein